MPRRAVGDFGMDIIVEASTNVTAWFVSTSNSLALPFIGPDAGATNFPFRFYHILPEP